MNFETSNSAESHSERIAAKKGCFQWKESMLVLLISYLVLMIIVGRSAFFSPETPTIFASLADGTAPRPFVTRTLAPRICGIFHEWIINSDLKSALMFMSDFANKDLGIIPKQSDEALSLLFIYSIMFLVCINITIVFIIKLIRTEHSSSFLRALFFAGFLFVVIAFASFQKHLYPYDLPSMAFSAAGLYFMLQRKYLFYAVILILYPVQRETAVILPLIYAIVEFKNIPKIRLFLLTVCQLAIVVIIRILVNDHYSGNEGTVAYIMLVKNFTESIDAKTLPLTLIALIAPYLIYKNTKNLVRDELRVAMLVMYSFGLVMHLVFGILAEVRTLFDLVPLIGLVAYPLANKFFDSVGCSHNDQIPKT